MPGLATAAAARSSQLQTKAAPRQSSRALPRAVATPTRRPSPRRSCFCRAMPPRSLRSSPLRRLNCASPCASRFARLCSTFHRFVSIGHACATCHDETREAGQIWRVDTASRYCESRRVCQPHSSFGICLHLYCRRDLDRSLAYFPHLVPTKDLWSLPEFSGPYCQFCLARRVTCLLGLPLSPRKVTLLTLPQLLVHVAAAGYGAAVAGRCAQRRQGQMRAQVGPLIEPALNMLPKAAGGGGGTEREAP